MTATSPQRLQSIEWSVATRALPGQLVSGDLHLVTARGPDTLAAVVNGLGQGEEATTAAQIAVDVVEQYATEPLVRTLQRCHDALQKTRGVEMTVVVFHPMDNTLSAIGI